MVLGLLALSEGVVAGAAEQLWRAIEILDEMGVEEPGAFPVLPDAIEALARSGQRSRAEALVARLEQQVMNLKGAWASAGLERSRGVLSLAAGEPDAALAPLEAADAALAPLEAADAALAPLEAAEAAFTELGFRPEAARAHLLHGQALLRGGRRTHAADVLAESRDRFAGMGAALWKERALDELERVAPGRSGSELTST
ncbi:MAG: hypothetical protein ACRDGK_01825, partial [Actinomycetota bacterium]